LAPLPVVMFSKMMKNLTTERFFAKTLLSELAQKAFMVMLLCSLTISAYAQLSISGKVTDSETKKGLAGATLTIDNTMRGTITDAQGNFVIKNLKKGTYTIKVSFVGFEKQSNSIELQQNTNISFSLQKSSFMADEVVVNATRANEKSAVAYTNVSKEDLQKQNLGQDIPQLLNFTPSLVTTSDAGAGIGYTGIRIRGTDATRINVTINGIPLNDAESQGVYWVNMPDFASSTNSIQIQRGVGTSTNGAGAFGASVNMSTNEFRKDAYAESNNSFGSFNTFKNTVLVGSGLLNNRFTLDARLSRLKSDGYIDRASSDLRSFYLSGAYFTKKSFYRLNVFSGKEKTYQAWEGVPEYLLSTNRTYNPYTYPNQTDNYQQDHYQLLSSHSLSSNWSFNFNLHYTYGRGYYEQFKEQDKFSKYGLPNVVIGNTTITKTDLVRQKWLDNDFYGSTFSFDYKGNNRLSANIGGAWNQYDGRHYGQIIWAQYASTAKLGDKYYSGTALKTDFNIYGKVYYQLSEQLNAFADLQYRTVGYSIKGIDDNLVDISQSKNYNFFNPKMGLTYQVSAGTSAFLSYSIGNKEPNRSDFVDNPGKAPQAETLRDLEAGFKTQQGKVAFEANAYWMDYKNQLVLTGKLNDVGTPIRVNVPSSYRMGLELQAGVQLTKAVKWNVNATLSSNKINNFTEVVPSYDEPYIDVENKFAKTDIAFSPNVIGGSQLLYTPTKGLELGLLSKYVGKQYMDNTSNENRKLNAYFTNDLRILYTFKPSFCKELGLSLLGNNIFNTLYESNGYTYSYIYEGKTVTENFYYPQAGFNFLLGVNIKF